jgi:hypothetical protein
MTMWYRHSTATSQQHIFHETRLYRVLSVLSRDAGLGRLLQWGRHAEIGLLVSLENHKRGDEMNQRDAVVVHPLLVGSNIVHEYDVVVELALIVDLRL